MRDHLQEHGLLTNGYTTKENIFLCQKPSSTFDPWGKVGIKDLKFLPTPWQEVDGTNFLWLITASLSSWVQSPPHTQKKCPTTLHPITFFPPSLLWYSLTPGGNGPIYVWPLNSHSQHIEESWGSVVTISHCKAKLLWPNLTSALICEDKFNYLQGSLMSTSCLLSETTALESTFVPTIFQAHSIDQICNTY